MSTNTVTTLSARARAFPDLDGELASTRRVLERVPEDKWSWQPHDKSMSLSRNATHLVEVLSIAESIVTSDFFDLVNEHIPAPATHDELLRMFDAQAEAVRAGVDAVASHAWAETWQLRKGDIVARSMPRLAALRFVGLNHLIHHRGQLTVYLRLLGVPVPGCYGPSADER